VSDPLYVDYYSTDRLEFFRRAFITLGFNGIAGDYAEFGCYSGTTFNLAFQEYSKAAKHLSFLNYRFDRKLWALDSFRGLPPPAVPPDDHPAWTPGNLSMSVDDFHAVCARNAIPREAYRVVEGYYEDTLRVDDTSPRLPQDIALAYIDCDLYSSVMAVLRYLQPRLKHGAIVALDDYFCYSATQASGARRAAVEFLSTEKDWRLIPYFQYGWAGMSYIVESRAILPDRLVSGLHGFI
jgi:O-methyltransferase